MRSVRRVVIHSDYEQRCSFVGRAWAGELWVCDESSI